MEVYFKRRLVLSEEISVLRMSVKIYNQAMQENTLDTFTISYWRNKIYRRIGYRNIPLRMINSSLQSGDCLDHSEYFFTCHDDMKDAGFPLLPHGVGGGAEESAVVHGVLRSVAQAALSALTLGSLVGHPKHYAVNKTGGQWIREGLIYHLVTLSPAEVHFFKGKSGILMRRPVWYLWWCGVWCVVH